MNENMIRIVTVIQARTRSTRLPNKVMLPLLGEPLLVRMVERVKAACLVGSVVVATTTDPHDDVIAALCQRRGFHCFRGHPTDLLDRHYQAGKAFGADAVVKIPSDVPLIDPDVIDRVLAVYLDDPGRYDFVSNLHPASYPDGNDVEVMSMQALRRAWQGARRPLEREHTTPYLWENPQRFAIGNLSWESGLDYSMSHRWTIDYPEDYWFIRAVYEALYPHNPRFSLSDILELLERQPEIARLNAKYAGVNWYRHHLGELRTITPEHTRRLPEPQAEAAPSSRERRLFPEGQAAQGGN
jgi:spore coat polysaccharide biosynthesis protein SpsF